MAGALNTYKGPKNVLIFFFMFIMNLIFVSDRMRAPHCFFFLLNIIIETGDTPEIKGGHEGNSQFYALTIPVGYTFVHKFNDFTGSIRKTTID